MARIVRNGRGRQPSIGRGVAAGLVGGLVATWAMNQFQALWSRVVDRQAPESAAGRHDAREWQERNEDQNANEILAERLAATTLGRRLEGDELAAGAALVHFSFGAAMGALFGALAEGRPQRLPWTGAAWGTAIWLAADEIAVPMFRLSRPDVEYPAEAHVQAFSAHLVYGIATEAVQRALRASVLR